MPFTQFHLGFGLFLGILLYRYLDFPTFILANLIVDLRAGLVFFDLVPGKRSVILHSYLGSVPVIFLLAVTMIYTRKYIKTPDQGYSKTSITLASFSGVYLHVFLDSFTHPDMMPFYPLGFKPFYGVFSASQLELISIVLLIASVALASRKFDLLKNLEGKISI